MNNCLINRYFITLDAAGKADKQGRIIGRPEEGFYLCQLFSWLDGRATDTFVARVDEMLRWRLFDEEEWKAEIDKEIAFAQWK